MPRTRGQNVFTLCFFGAPEQKSFQGSPRAAAPTWLGHLSGMFSDRPLPGPQTRSPGGEAHPRSLGSLGLKRLLSAPALQVGKVVDRPLRFTAELTRMLPRDTALGSVSPSTGVKSKKVQEFSVCTSRDAWHWA